MTALACHFPGCAHPATVGRLCRMHGGGRPTSTSPVQRVHTTPPLSSVPRPTVAPLAPAPAPSPKPRAPRPHPVSLVDRAHAPCDDLDLTLREKILVAAAGLEAESFSVENLVVACWTRWPHTFGLRGYEERHPDAARVQAKLAGVDGVLARGWIERVSERELRVLPKGQRHARALLRREPEGAPGSELARTPRPLSVCITEHLHERGAMLVTELHRAVAPQYEPRAFRASVDKLVRQGRLARPHFGWVALAGNAGGSP